MKNHQWTWPLALVLALAVVSPILAGESHRCTEDTQACLNKLAASLKERGWVGIEVDRDEESGTLTVVRVEPDSPAMEAGMREGDVLLAMNGIRYGDEANHEKLYKAKRAMKIGKTVNYTVDRQGCCHIKGGEQEVAVTLAKVPASVMAQMVGGHMLEHVAVEIAQD